MNSCRGNQQNNVSISMALAQSAVAAPQSTHEDDVDPYAEDGPCCVIIARRVILSVSCISLMPV